VGGFFVKQPYLAVWTFRRMRKILWKTALVSKFLLHFFFRIFNVDWNYNRYTLHFREDT